ncbi:hypothetical protein BJP46_00660 [Paenibacillus odorifer]|nr:hypothetical protein BJP46_00660 [Paenibacillus odorifer]
MYVLEHLNTQVLQYLNVLCCWASGLLDVLFSCFLSVGLLNVRLTTYSAFYIPTHPFTMSDRTQMQLFGQISAFTGSFGLQRRYSFQTYAICGLFEPIETMESDRFANEPNFG